MPIINKLRTNNTYDIQDARVDKLITEVETNTANIETNTQNIEKNKQEIEANADLINQINIRTQRDVGAVNVLIGDSLAQGNKSNLKCGWAYQLKKFWGNKTYINAVSGTGFCVVWKNFTQMLQETITQMSEEDKINCKNVVVLGGLNDVMQNFDAAEIGTGVTNVYNLAKETFPNARIFIAPLNTFVSLNSPYLFGYKAIFEYTMSLGGESTSAFIDLISGFQKYEYNNDRTHLTEGGYIWFTWNLLNILYHNDVMDEQIYNDNEILYKPQFTSVGSYIRYKGGKVSFQIVCAVNGAPTSGDIIVCTLPKNIKPNEIRYVTGCTVSNSIAKAVPVQVAINGEVAIKQYSGEAINEFYLNGEYDILPKTSKTT